VCRSILAVAGEHLTEQVGDTEARRLTLKLPNARRLVLTVDNSLDIVHVELQELQLALKFNSNTDYTVSRSFRPVGSADFGGGITTYDKLNSEQVSAALAEAYYLIVPNTTTQTSLLDLKERLAPLAHLSSESPSPFKLTEQDRDVLRSQMKEALDGAISGSYSDAVRAIVSSILFSTYETRNQELALSLRRLGSLAEDAQGEDRENLVKLLDTLRIYGADADEGANHLSQDLSTITPYSEVPSCLLDSHTVVEALRVVEDLWEGDPDYQLDPRYAALCLGAEYLVDGETSLMGHGTHYRFGAINRMFQVPDRDMDCGAPRYTGEDFDNLSQPTSPGTISGTMRHSSEQYSLNEAIVFLGLSTSPAFGPEPFSRDAKEGPSTPSLLHNPEEVVYIDRHGQEISQDLAAQIPSEVLAGMETRRADWRRGSGMYAQRTRAEHMTHLKNEHPILAEFATRQELIPSWAFVADAIYNHCTSNRLSTEEVASMLDTSNTQELQFVAPGKSSGERDTISSQPNEIVWAYSKQPTRDMIISATSHVRQKMAGGA
jgi:hypothetical protein